MIDDIKVTNLKELEDNDSFQHDNEYGNFEYFKGRVVNGYEGNKSHISFMKIPPRKYAYPYHYHTENEETFYIISGSAVVKTPIGEKYLKEGDIIFFPANEKGAHKIYNPSETEDLIYLDFDTHNDPNICFYPDSNKIGIYGEKANYIFKLEDDRNYYDGE